MVNISALKMFSDLVDYASFSKSAHQNQVSQSAVSQQIKSLEKHFNINLIEKGQKSFQLTRAGNVLYKYAQQILSSYTSMIEDIRDPSYMTSGELSITTSFWIGLYVLPSIIHNYFERFQKFHININHCNFQDVKFRVLNPHSDLFLFESPIVDSKFTSKIFLQESFIPIGAKTFFPKPTTLTTEKIKRLPIIGFSKQHPLRKIFDNTKHSLQIRYRIEYNQIELMKQAILSYNSIAFLPKSSLNLAKDRAQFQYLNFDKSLNFPLYISYAANTKLSSNVQNFLSVFEDI